MKIKITSPTSLMILPGSIVECDDLTADAAIRAKVAELMEEDSPKKELPRLTTPKKRYRLNSNDPEPSLEEKE